MADACLRTAYKTQLKKLAAVLGPKVPREHRRGLHHLAKNAAERACAGGRPPGIALRGPKIKQPRKTYVDYDGAALTIGSRVELHPGLDLWMRGAQFGTIAAIRGDQPCVRMDHPQIRNLVCIPADRLKRR